MCAARLGDGQHYPCLCFRVFHRYVIDCLLLDGLVYVAQGGDAHACGAWFLVVVWYCVGLD